jgi:hypothetical protein
LQKYRDEQKALVESYGWVDEPLGIVRIPIDRAIDLVAAQQLPWRAHAAPAPMLPGGIPAASVGAGAASGATPPVDAVPVAPHPAPAPAHDAHSGGHR